MIFPFVILILFVSLQSLYNFYAVGQEELRLLSKIQSPKDLRQLKVEELSQVCDELRQDIVQELSVNPGHLASSLGVAEITVALHYVYKSYGMWVIRRMDIRSLLGGVSNFAPTANWEVLSLSPPLRRVNTTLLPADMPPTPYQQH